MAGGKETPRQKLIGMMYLVLLALLAMNVSSDILNKFVQLDDSLAQFVKEGKSSNDRSILAIADKVAETGNKEGEVANLTSAQTLHGETIKILDEIDKIKAEMVEVTGGKVDGQYQGKKNNEGPALILLGSGDAKSGKSYTYLEPELTKYVDNANVIFTAIKKQLKEDSKGNEFSSLTLDPKEDPQYYIGRDDKAGKKGRLDDHVKGKDWSQVNFDHSPMVACLARLTDIQSKLVTIDTKVISLVKNSLGAADFKFDKLGVMANADANTVVAGTPYRAQIFLTAYSDKLQPKITVSGKNLKVVNGKGEYKRLASASGKADKDGLFTNSYVATIEVPDPLNPAEMKKFTETIKYKVAKPVIKVESGAVSALYLNCGNALNITVPALGAMYKPKFTVTKGAASITGTNGKGKVVIIPTKPGKVTIRVSSGGQTIGSQTFGVRSVPKPKFILRKSNVKGKKVNLKNGEKLPGPSTLYVQSFVDDETFKTNLPKDSKYKVVKWKVEILKGSRPLGSKTFTSPSGNIRSLLGKASDGARIYCEVQKVKRKNYQGKLLDVKIPIESFTINLSK